MRERPPYLPSRETLESYLCALIPPSITTLDEQVDFLEEEFVRAVEKALAEQMLRVGEWGHEATKARHAREIERARLEAKIEAIDEMEFICICEGEDDLCPVCAYKRKLHAARAALDAKGDAAPTEER